MIDSHAVVSPSARIAPGVMVGPFSVIGPDVEIDEGCTIGPHVVIRGPTHIGKDNQVFQFASIGDMPQDKKYNNEPTRLEIGDRNVIREGCTINRGTMQDQGVTRIGDDNWIMAYVHIAHDCVVGNNCILANNASLAGHVRVDDFVILGGFTLVHQFCAIGAHAFTGMGSAIAKDVPPYIMVSGSPAHAHGLNSEGLKRRGFSPEALVALKRAYKILYRSQLSFEDAVVHLREQENTCPELRPLLVFLEQQTRGIIR